MLKAGTAEPEEVVVGRIQGNHMRRERVKAYAISVPNIYTTR
jgi:ribosome biogenesis SPOUT family RNA methylase Rps3